MKAAGFVVTISADRLERIRRVESFFDEVCAERGAALEKGAKDPFARTSVRETIAAMHREADRRFSAAQGARS